ncbi:MAG: TRAP transporter substrate-binding protein DctP [Deltaproteobacteria bacterium]|nr:TRAP transporter substrate-binding protein DctP [Deltaproteobacteria bacterium]
MKFYRDVYTQVPEFADELKKFNQKLVYISPSLPTAFISNKPFDSLEQLKGGKWRASSRWHLLFLKNAGATAVSIPWGEMYMSLQTGAVDGCMSNYDGLHMTKQDEVAPNILVARELWFATPFMVTINLDVWNSLSKADQEGIEKAAAIALEKYEQAYADGVTGIFDAEKKAGLNPRYLDIEAVSRWAETCASAKADQQWLEDLKSARIVNAESIVARLSALHAKAIEEDRKITMSKN